MKDIFARYHSSIPIFSFPMPTICPFPPFFLLFVEQTPLPQIVVLNLGKREEKMRNAILHILLCVLFNYLFKLLYMALHGVKNYINVCVFVGDLHVC